MKAKQPRSKSSRKPVAPADERWIPGIKDAELKQLLAERAKANPHAAPSAKPHKKTGPVPGFVFMRPVFTDFGYVDDDDGDPDPDRPPRDPCAGQTWVWQPDLAVQLNTGEATCPSSVDLKRIEQALGGHLSRFRLPDPEVRVQCTEGRIYIRVWGTRVQPDSCADQARRRAQVPDLVAGGNFGLYINAALIRRAGGRRFSNRAQDLQRQRCAEPERPFSCDGSVGRLQGAGRH